MGDATSQQRIQRLAQDKNKKQRNLRRNTQTITTMEITKQNQDKIGKIRTRANNRLTLKLFLVFMIIIGFQLIFGPGTISLTLTFIFLIYTYHKKTLLQNLYTRE